MDNFPFSLVDWAWSLELVTLSIAWMVLAGSKKERIPLRTCIGTAGLFLVMNAAFLLLAYVFVRLQWNGIFPIMRVLCQGLVTYIYMRCFSTGTVKAKAVLWLVMTVASLSIVAIAGKCSRLVGMSFGSGVPEGVTRVLIYMTMIPAAFLLRRFRFSHSMTVPSSGMILMTVDVICVLGLQFIDALNYFDSTSTYPMIMLFAYCITLCMGIAAIYALYTMARTQMTIIDLQAEKQRFISEQEQTRMTEAMLHNLRAIRHDLKNQYAYMQILLNEKRYTELEAYFSELLKELPAPLQMVDCGNHTVNTVLNMEFAKLRADDVAIYQQLAVPPVLPFSDEEICAILTNLIDNAAEECRRLKQDGAKELTVSLDIHPHKSYLFIRCANPTSRTSLDRNRSGLKTTKEEAEFHGYGTQIIARIAGRYNGESDFHLEGDQFVAQVMLDMTSEEIK